MSTRQPENVKQIHEYLVRHFISMDPFTKQQLGDEFEVPNFSTYWTKKIRPLLVEIEDGFRVSEYFRKYLEFEEFSKHWSQSGKYLSKYDPDTREYLSFQFFLPLANELILKQTLDDLFFSERLQRRIKTINRRELNRRHPKGPGESTDVYWSASEFSVHF